MRSLAILTGLALTTACSTGGTVPTDPTYDGDVQPIFDDQCVGCHGATHPSGSLDLTAADGYAALVGVTAGEADMPYVDPGNPDNSFLMKKIDGTAGDVPGADPGRMPDGGPAMDSTLQDTIRVWIENGAPEN